MSRWIAAALIALAGCQSPCQQLCATMAELSEECGVSVPDSELDDCVDAFASASADENETCATYGHPDVIRNEWTCDDINLFRSQPGGGAAARMLRSR